MATGRKKGLGRSHTTSTADKSGKWREVFSMFDANLDGKVSHNELAHKMRSLGLNATDDEMNDLLNEWDREKKGGLTLAEFTEMMTRRQAKREKAADSGFEERMELKAAFDLFDRDKNGYLDAEEIQIGLRLIGEEVSEEDVAYIMHEADTDGDGLVSFREFCQIVRDMNTSRNSPFYFKGKSAVRQQQRRSPRGTTMEYSTDF